LSAQEIHRLAPTNPGDVVGLCLDFPFTAVCDTLWLPLDLAFHDWRKHDSDGSSSPTTPNKKRNVDRFCPLGGRGVNGRAEASDRPGQSGRNFALGRKSCRYVGVALRFPGLGFGRSRRGIEPQEMKLPAVEQFPLNFITRLQPDSDGQGQREAHIQAGILSARTDRLNSQRISGLHFF